MQIISGCPSSPYWGNPIYVQCPSMPLLISENIGWKSATFWDENFSFAIYNQAAGLYVALRCRKAINLVVTQKNA